MTFKSGAYLGGSAEDVPSYRLDAEAWSLCDRFVGEDEFASWFLRGITNASELASSLTSRTRAPRLAAVHGGAMREE